MDDPRPDLYLSLAYEDYKRITCPYAAESHLAKMYDWFWGHYMKVNTKGMDHTLSEEEVAAYRKLREDHQLDEEGLRRFRADARIGINMGWEK